MFQDSISAAKALPGIPNEACRYIRDVCSQTDSRNSTWVRRTAYGYDFEYLPFENVEWEDYNGISDAAKKLKLRAPSIKKVLNKVIEFTGGYTFEWVNDVIWVKKKKNYLK